MERLTCPTYDDIALRAVVHSVWGFDQLLPVQAEAMACVVQGRDSLVVLPTGGGKSLCFQAPVVWRKGLAVVVSPLIALMKDQVDGLRELGVAAEALHSAQSAEHRAEVLARIRNGECRLLYVAPETLMRPQLLEVLSSHPPLFWAIDEAHCISTWGHDFRPEYRGLAQLRQRFPDIPLHAYTATATPEVRREIASTLGLCDPQILVGDFFRANLQYQVAKRTRSLNQLVSVIERHPGESGIIYCISRAETEEVALGLQQLGFAAAAYHAGLSDALRTARQEAFLHSQTAILVATVAFGMGIDKTDVRFVIHAGMPKSLAHYQQESGRAGRDGLPAECWLLYSGQDLFVWRRILENSPPEQRGANDALLQSIHSYCVSTRCRHRHLVEHFGQVWTREACEACDVCRGQYESVAEPLVLGQKILSCVARVRENFGAIHVARVLQGSQHQAVLAHHHETLSTFGLLREFRLADIRDWIEQLISQQFLRRDGEFGVLKVTESGWQLMRGGATPVLGQASRQAAQATRSAIIDSWEGVDRGLFDDLRIWRRAKALSRNLPPYLILSDVTLRDLARRRPTREDAMRLVHGIGERKLQDFAAELVPRIAEYCAHHQLETNLGPPPPPQANESKSLNASTAAAFALFAQGRSVSEVAATLSRAESTTSQYLEQFILQQGITDPEPWLDAATLETVQVVVQYAGLERLRPIHEALHARIPYNQLRIAVALLRNRGVTVVPN